MGVTGASCRVAIVEESIVAERLAWKLGGLMKWDPGQFTCLMSAIE